MQKFKKPRENQKKQKTKKKQYSRTLAKVKCKNPKNKKKQKKTIFQDSCLLTLSPDFWNIVFFGFFCFFGFLEVFWIFAFYFCKSPGILVFFSFFGFFWFSRGFLNFGIFTFAGVLEYCFFWCFLVFSRFWTTPLFAMYPLLLYWIVYIHLFSFINSFSSFLDS